LAEQIEALFWKSGAPDLAADVDRFYDQGTIKKDEDLTQYEI